MPNHTTYIDYANTPASDRPTTLPGAFDPDRPLGSHSQADVSRKPSVGVPRDPVVRKAPADGDEDEAEDIRHPTTTGQKSAFVEDLEDDADADNDARSPSRAKSAHRRSTSGAASDSGYGSTSTGPVASSPAPPRPHSRASQASTRIEPIPILWSESPSQDAHQRGQAWQRSLHDRDDGASDDDDENDDGRRGDRSRGFKRASSLRSFRSVPAQRPESAAEGGERASTRTSVSVLRKRRVSLSGGSFAGGAGTVGPAASPAVEESFDARSRSAEASLSEKQKLKLNKAQVKEGKKVAKIIKAEGKAEQKALEEAVKELADIQKLQKAAVKEEAKSYTSYAKALREFHKAELEFFAARAKYERAQADLQAHEDAREASKQHAQDATEMLQEKNREVEWLRAQKAVDDRERGAKIRHLTGKA
ncbi:hypothetical protein BD413DRAFT_533921 [Trametes elegans]|nr:hypothetical protein BD413DRAFT_533921 [Trametes elegans]